MLILISLLPTTFAINPNIDISEIKKNIDIIQSRFDDVDITKVSFPDASIIENSKENISAIKTIINKENIEDGERITIRQHILKVQKDYTSLSTAQLLFIPKANATSNNSLEDIAPNIANISNVTDYAPWWVIAMISISLGLGTMVGWKRIVITIGEKIGKDKLTYAQ